MPRQLPQFGSGKIWLVVQVDTSMGNTGLASRLPLLAFRPIRYPHGEYSPAETHARAGGLAVTTPLSGNNLSTRSKRCAWQDLKTEAYYVPKQSGYPPNNGIAIIGIKRDFLSSSRFRFGWEFGRQGTGCPQIGQHIDEPDCRFSLFPSHFQAAPLLLKVFADCAKKIQRAGVFLSRLHYVIEDLRHFCQKSSKDGGMR